MFWDILPTVIIKGVCDYADSHKNKEWQRYVAVTAVACMKAFLEEWKSAGGSSRSLHLSIPTHSRSIIPSTPIKYSKFFGLSRLL